MPGGEYSPPVYAFFIFFATFGSTQYILLFVARIYLGILLGPVYPRNLLQTVFQPHLAMELFFLSVKFKLKSNLGVKFVVRQV